MKPIIFDTETTGTDHKTDQIIEAAWLELPEFPHQFAALQPVEFPHYHERFKPNVPISLGAQAVHHIICQDLVGCRESKEFALPADPLLMIGHNVDFDWRTAPADRAIEHDRADEPVDDNTYFVMRNAGRAVFVKHGPFFVSQGGLTEDWGKNWKRIRAGSLKHARQVGEELLP